MCKAFSCVIGRDKTVTWRFGTDSHEDLIRIAGYKDDTLDPEKIEFCRIEISPKNGSYLEPDKWVFKIDMDVTPAWWTLAHKRACEREHKKWKEQLDKVLVRKPIVHPFQITPPEKITDEHIQLVREWASVWAYSGTFFIIPRSDWKYTENIPGEGYPFQPAVTLWEMGLVPSFDGRTWRLHGGPDGRVLWEGVISHV